MQAEETDDALLRHIRAGDENAFVSLYRRFQAPIYRFVLNMTGSPTTAEDVTQEVFLALLREDCGFNAERGNLAGYLFGIARKQVLRNLERYRGTGQEWEDNERGNLEPAVVPDPMVDLLQREGIAALRKAILSLPGRYREVVVLCDLEEVDYLEAAALLDCPVGTVRSRLHRARALLLEKLQQKRPAKPDVRGLDPARSWA